MLKINNYYSFKLGHSENLAEGLLLGIGENWLMLINIIEDYRLDGYCFINFNHIKGYHYEKEEKFKQKVIRKKNAHKKSYLIPNLNDTSDLLKTLSFQACVEIELINDEDVSYLGKIKKINSEIITINSLNSKGIWDGEEVFELKNISNLRIETDYCRSLMLLTGDIEVW